MNRFWENLTQECPTNLKSHLRRMKLKDHDINFFKKLMNRFSENLAQKCPINVGLSKT